MKTEVEAGQLWCPEVRILTYDEESPTSYNRYSDGGFPFATHCIASSCMAWRWASIKKPILNEDGTWDHDSPWESVESDKGYCGKFGKPE